MKVFKLEIMLLEEDVETMEEAETLVVNARLPNHISLDVMSCREAEIGEWHDDHLLNNYNTLEAEMNRLFPNK